MLPWNTSELLDDKAALWFLGQAGYYMKAAGKTVIIDPYLSDSVGKAAPLFARAYPVPVEPNLVEADIFIVTHDHMDHLDPETIEAYQYKDTTEFVAPRHAAKKLASLGIKNINVVDHNDSVEIKGVKIDGVFALATGPDCLDTCGYSIGFENGKTVYHTSDTAFCNLLLKAAPKVDVLLPCINGKWGDLHIADAIELTLAVGPRYVIPNHYDVMALNSENPESFRYFLKERSAEAECVILQPMEAFVW